MKKLLLILAITMFSYSAKAQIEFGFSIGFPVGDISEISNVVFNFEGNYYFASEGNFRFGLATGFMTFNMDDAGLDIVPNLNYIPLALGTKFFVNENIFVGVDLGYGIGVSDYPSESGFYYKPKASYMISDQFSANLAFSGVASDYNASSFMLGLTYSLN